MNIQMTYKYPKKLKKIRNRFLINIMGIGIGDWGLEILYLALLLHLNPIPLDLLFCFIDNYIDRSPKIFEFLF